MRTRAQPALIAPHVNHVKSRIDFFDARSWIDAGHSGNVNFLGYDLRIARGFGHDNGVTENLAFPGPVDNLAPSNAVERTGLVE